MMTSLNARRMGAAWCDAWNRRDLDAIMAHYSEDVAFRSPSVVERWGAADGWLHGRTRLRDSFAQSMTMPGLHLTLVDVLLGAHAVSILYRRETGDLVCDTMEFDLEGRVHRVVACYGAPAGAVLPSPVVVPVSVPVSVPVVVPVVVPVGAAAPSGIREVETAADMPQSREAIWAVLTRPALIARWLLPNDFAPVPGHRFSFRAQPVGGWDGVVFCEVLQVEEHHLLTYRWIASGEPAMRDGISMDTIVTWTVDDMSLGTRLRLAHAGHHSLHDAAAYRAMNPDWKAAFATIGRLAAELGS